jgi:signal transduction histidine kinase
MNEKSNISPELYSIIKEEYERVSHLPFPVHVTTWTGEFLMANNKASYFFEPGSPVGLVGKNICKYYKDPLRERAQILKELKPDSHRVWLERLSVRLSAHEKKPVVSFACMPFFDQNGVPVAMLKVGDGMSELEWFKDFEEKLPVGFFEIGEDYTIRWCNLKLAKILHFNSPEELIGKHVIDLFWHKEDAVSVLRKLREKFHFEGEQIKIRRNDSVMTLLKVNCTADIEPDGDIRIKGIVQDVTFDVIQNRIPVGLFMITANKDGSGDVFSQVNESFLEIHGFHSSNEVIGKSADIFHVNPKDLVQYRKALEKANAQNQPLLDYYMEILNQKKEKRYVVLNIFSLPDENNKVRIGAVYDLTNHVGRNIRLLENNFSAILHTYLSTLNALRDTLYNISMIYGRDYMRDDRTIDRARALQEIEHHKKAFEVFLGELYRTLDKRGLDVAVHEKIAKSWNMINKHRETFGDKEKDSVAWLRKNLLRVDVNLKDLKGLPIGRELQKSLGSQVEEILRITSLLSIVYGIDELNERLPDFNYFRDYLLRGNDPESEKPSVQNIVTEVEKQIKRLQEFAASKGVVIVQHFSLRNSVPVACRSNLGRAIYGLLNNAIKYSWTKGMDKAAHVDIHIERKRNEVEIMIENWGVPIRKEELHDNQIFQFGRRGVEADDRGRSGTGIGLYDANEIITQHNGVLRLTSEPTIGNSPEVYSNPFITRVYITLPTAE